MLCKTPCKKLVKKKLILALLFSFVPIFQGFQNPSRATKSSNFFMMHKFFPISFIITLFATCITSQLATFATCIHDPNAVKPVKENMSKRKKNMILAKEIVP